jgi:hypothetical protein
MHPSIHIAIFIAAVFAAQISSAQPMASPSTQQIEELRVLATEDEYVAAEVSRDEVALRRLVDDRFQYNTSRGITTGKEELIQSLEPISKLLSARR